MFGLTRNDLVRAPRQADRGWTGRTESSSLESLARRRPVTVSLGTLALVALAVTVGVYFYPELMRTIHMHRM